MKMSKIEGLNIMKLLDFPTVQLIDPNLLDKNSQVLKQGLSARTSPKKNLADNVYLPAIHNCTNLEELRQFVEEYKNEYYIIVHKTVKPEKIGSISRYEAGEEKVVIEIFEDFDKRKDGIIENRMILPIRGEKFSISELQIQKNNKKHFNLFTQVIKQIKYMPFRKFDAEFVVEDEKILFTDLSIQNRVDQQYAEELKKKSQLKDKERNEIEK